MNGDAAYLGNLPGAVGWDSALPPLRDSCLVHTKATRQLSAAANDSDNGIEGHDTGRSDGAHASEYSHPTLACKHILLPRAASLPPTLGGVQTAILTQSDHQRAAGDRLRRLIKLLGMSYVEAAETMNVSKHVLNHWMSGNHPIQPYPLYRLCRSKGVNFDYVFLGDWSSLPHRMGREIEAELLPSRVAVGASARKDA